MFKTVEWTPEGVRLLDQRKLPAEEVYIVCRDYPEVAEAIRNMTVRGAPAIGVTAAMGVALGVRNARAATLAELQAEFERIAGAISQTRPTAVNLFWAVARMRKSFERALATGGGEGGEGDKISRMQSCLEQEAQKILAEDVAANVAMGRYGAQLLGDSATVLTHCNAGALATGGYGTALGVIRAAVAAGKRIRVFADETRPFLQGARLTAWELAQDGIPVTLITDSMAGHFMKQGSLDAVIVGADRIAANGDVANKIGTYTAAVVAHENGIPFYVAAPLSTIDRKLSTGDEIPIEERSPEEVTHISGIPIAPAGAEARHPAFDVTPNRYITAIITERGIARPPYAESLRRLFEQPDK
ncbi:MAG: S-methyl-5-thioribose-1-phosphate isomerase [Terriglobia bacterium]